MSPKTKQKSILGAVALLVSFVVGLAYVSGVFWTLQEQLTDRFFTEARSEMNDEIVIVSIDEASLGAIGRWPWTRDTHARLLSRLDAASVVGFDLVFSEETSDDAVFGSSIARSSATVVLPIVIDEQSGVFVDPVRELGAVSESGIVNTAPSRDGVVRFAELHRHAVRSFDLAVAGMSDVAGFENRVRIPFRGPAQTFTTLSYIDVFEGNIAPEMFEGKTVLIGASAAGLGDLYQTPFGSMSGVEIHANTIAALKDGAALTPLHTPAALLGIVSMVLLAGGIVQYARRTRYMSAFSVLAILGLFSIAGFAFDAGILIPHLYFLAAFVFALGGFLVARYVSEAKEKDFIKKSFAQYIDPAVVDELCERPEKLALGGETRTLSILFSDIRSFTTISEQLTPAELMEQLNEYLEEMSESIMTNNGLVDKYIGDAVMAFWGAPLENKKHAVHACQSVIAMMRALEELNEKWTDDGKPSFAIGVGISTGDVVVGNMGSQRRFNYSIIGDEVNFSARIEGLTKQYGVKCLIGERTFELVKDVPELRERIRELDDVMVKGKKEPRRIYELSTTETVDKNLEKLFQQFARGRKAYIAGDFKAAIAAFTEALQIDENDGPSKVFLERSENLLQNPPTEWNGVFEFTSK